MTNLSHIWIDDEYVVGGAGAVNVTWYRYAMRACIGSFMVLRCRLGVVSVSEGGDGEEKNARKKGRLPPFLHPGSRSLSPVLERPH